MVHMDTKRCETCGQEFSKPYTASAKVWAQRRYCSRACFGKDYANRFQQQRSRICPSCGKTFTPERNWGAKYCSPSCAKYRFKRGAEHQSWKGGRTVDKSGYVRIRVWADEPIVGEMVGKKDYVMEHRVVMAKHLGRPLETHETVHHKDGNRSNNDISNLELRTGQHGKGATKHCPTCTCED